MPSQLANLRTAPVISVPPRLSRGCAYRELAGDRKHGVTFGRPAVMLQTRSCLTTWALRAPGTTASAAHADLPVTVTATPCPQNHRNHETEKSMRAMECHLEWRTSKVENYELSVSLHPAPDFAFMVEFDRFLDQYKQSDENRWGRVLLAQGKVVVSDMQPEFAHELRAFLEDAVREANRLAVDYRTYARQQEEDRAAAAAQRQAAEEAAAHTAAERDKDLTDEFRA